jgi:hypothetical protein
MTRNGLHQAQAEAELDAVTGWRIASDNQCLWLIVL